MKLSILILSIDNEKRNKSLLNLINELNKQILENNLSNEVEIIINKDLGEKTIGFKRNEIKNKAIGKYIVFIDDDDMISNEYLSEIFKVIDLDYDIITFFVEHYINGKKQEILIHPNPNIDSMVIGNINFWINMLHLCPHKRNISEQVNFPNINNWEDLAYSREIKEFCNKQYRIDKAIYFYYKQI